VVVGGLRNALANVPLLTHNTRAPTMPTYEYACTKCGHEFERFQSMRDEPLKKCPKCNKAGLKRLVGGGAGLIFKGSGFYITETVRLEARAGCGGTRKEINHHGNQRQSRCP